MYALTTLATVLAASALVATPTTAYNFRSVGGASLTTKAATSVSADTKPCTIGLVGLNIVGRDVGSVRETNENEGCVAHCVANPQCKWYTWTDFEGGTCWLKSGDTTQIETIGQADAYSVFVRYMDVCPRVAFVLKDVDMFGGDIGDKPGANIEACYDMCLKWPGCEQYARSNADKGPTCWLKDGNAQFHRSDPGKAMAWVMQSHK